MKVVRLSALRTGRLYPQEGFLVLISVKRLSRPQGHNATGKIKSLKNFSDSIGNRTRGLPACSAVPQPTAPPHTSLLIEVACLISKMKLITRHLLCIVHSVWYVCNGCTSKHIFPLRHYWERIMCKKQFEAFIKSNSFNINGFKIVYVSMGYAVAHLVEALRYKPEGRGFDSRWSHWNFSVT
jgi:hypothetical protein